MRKKNNIAMTTALVFAIVSIAGTCGLVSAQVVPECEYPLFIQEGGVDANVMFVFDNSGSMNEIVYHPDFDPRVTYSGGLESDKTYYVSSNGYYRPSNFRSYQPTSPSIYLINSDNGEYGRYWGNYLNWLYWHATSEQIASMPLVTRVQASKTAVNEIVADNDNIRFGVMEFTYDNGGRLTVPIGADHTEVINRVNGITANTWTPLGETLVDVMEYFQKTGVDAPIQYPCQKCFIVIVTDGYPTMDLNVPLYIGDYDGDGREPGSCASIGCTTCPSSNDCTDYLDDVALYIRENDFRGDMEGDQMAFTYMIGFTLDAPLLQQTADNGGGLYFNANNATELRSSLSNILRDIVDRISSGSAVAVVSTEGQDEDLLYRGKFMPNKWRGYVEAFELPYEPGDPPLWEAGELLTARVPSTRTLFTSVDGQQVDFRPDYVESYWPKMEVPTLLDAIDIATWVMGYDVEGYRSHDGWILGDVIDSSPVVVGPPSSFNMNDNYLDFREAYAFRKKAIYIGANDGMLHALDAATGEEMWGYIPSACLPRLQLLADPDYCHEYFVNLTPMVTDAFVDGYWRTVLIGGQRHGGGMYFALDVTYPEYPTLMWELEVPEITESWAKPEIYRDKESGRYVAVFGSGPNYDTGDANVVAVDLGDGSVLWTDNLGTLAGVHMATAANSVDMDFDGYADLMYVSDLAGNVWRYDLASGSSPPDRSLLFATDQPIQAAPILTVDYNNDVFLYFGTGRYIDIADISDMSPNTFYSVIDDHQKNTVDRYDMVDQTSTINKLNSTDRGWYIDLVQGSGERIVEPDALVSGIVYFTSFAPKDEPCSAGGFSWLYSVMFRNGAAYDGNDDAGDDGTEGRVSELGEGIATKPVIDIVNENIIVQGSDTRIHVSNTQGVIRQLIVRSWRQMYN
jgi:type IV pilus assembly protein PilY1